MAKEYTTLDVAGQDVRLSSPGKVYFPPTEGHRGWTKLDLAEHYLRVADATINHLRERPTVLKRWKDGELARRDEEEGLGDALWPPNFAKQPGEPKRVQPSRAKE